MMINTTPLLSIDTRKRNYRWGAFACQIDSIQRHQPGCETLEIPIRGNTKATIRSGHLPDAVNDLSAHLVFKTQSNGPSYHFHLLDVNHQRS